MWFVIVCLTMAVYCRTGGSLPSNLIFCCFKYSRTVEKLHVKWRQSLSCYSSSQRFNHSHLRQNNMKNKSGTHHHRQSMESKTLLQRNGTFESIYQKKDCARRSILVHIKNRKDIINFQKFSTKFQGVTGIYHYGTEKNQRFALVEFNSRMDMLDTLKSPTCNLRNEASTNLFDFHGNVNNLDMKDPASVINLNPKIESDIINQLKKLGEGMIPLSEQIQFHYELVKLSDVQEKLRYFVLCQIETVFHKMHPHSLIMPFGSTVNGFGKYNSDLDLVFVPNFQNNNMNHNRVCLAVAPTKFNEINSDAREKSKMYLHTVADIIPYIVPGIRKVIRILSARVPILKFKHEATDLNCDLSINQMSGVYMSELLHVMGETDARVRPLVLLIREWARRRKITQSNPGPWITNFSLTLLFIFYLQTKKILPSVNLLKSFARYNDMVIPENGMNYTFLRRPELLPQHILNKKPETLENLLIGFFEYYSEFNYTKHSICLQTGAPNDNLDKSPLFICNPFDMATNVSKNVNSQELELLKKNFELSLRILTHPKCSSTIDNLLALSEDESVSENSKETVEQSSVEEKSN